MCQASRSITAHASPAYALSVDNSDSQLLDLESRVLGFLGGGESTEGSVARSQFAVKGALVSYGHHVVSGVHLSLRPCRQSLAPAMLVRTVRVTCASICSGDSKPVLALCDSSIDPLIRQLQPSV